MATKVNVKAFRLGTVLDWTSKWYSSKNYAKFLEQDTNIRRFIRKNVREAGVSEILIERSGKKLQITLQVGKPGLILGRNGTGLDELQAKIVKAVKLENTEVKLNILEVKKPNLNSDLIVLSIAQDLERRLPFRKIMKQTIERVMRSGAKGVKIKIGGRLNGADIARSETLSEGSIPLQTIRANIDFSRGTAQTTYGILGIKVWIYKGDVFTAADKEEEETSAPKIEMKK